MFAARHVRRRAAALVGAAAALATLTVGAPRAGVVAPPAAFADDAPAPELEAAVRALVADRHLEGAQIGVELVDVDSGRVLAAANEHLALNPASNAKLYTAAAALALLHENHRYQTSLVGTVKNGAVTGPLVLRGQGDPSLETHDLWALAQELRGAGVRRVEGDVLVDHKFYDDETTPPAFEQQPSEWAAFRAPVSAVAVNENTVTLTVRPSEPGKPAHVSFDPPGFVDVEGTVTTAGEGADDVGLVLKGTGGRLGAKVSGKVGEDARVVRYTRRVEDPRLLAGYALKYALEESGIKVTGEPKLGRGTGSVLARRESAPLSALLYALGKNSDNFYAEMVFKSLGAEVKGRPGRHADAGDVVFSWLSTIGANDTGVVIKNGSGLFDANRVTAHSTTQMLRWAYREPVVQSAYVAHLAIGGVDGTLHKRFRERRLHRAIRAKTGTLNDAIALSGYVLAPAGRSPVAFSIYFNKVSGKGGAARAAADRLVELVHDRLWAKAPR